MGGDELSHLSMHDRRVPDWSWWRKFSSANLATGPLLHFLIRDFGGDIVRGKGWKAYWIGDTSISGRKFGEDIGRVFEEVGEEVRADLNVRRRRLPLIRIAVVSRRLDIRRIVRGLALHELCSLTPNSAGYVWQSQLALLHWHPGAADFACALANILGHAFCHLLAGCRDGTTWSVVGYSHLKGQKYLPTRALRPISAGFADVVEARQQGLGWKLEHVLKATVADMTDTQLYWFVWVSACLVAFLRAEAQHDPAVWRFVVRSMSSDLPIKVSDVERIERVFGQPLADIEARFDAYCEEQAKAYRDSMPGLPNRENALDDPRQETDNPNS